MLSAALETGKQHDNRVGDYTVGCSRGIDFKIMATYASGLADVETGAGDDGDDVSGGARLRALCSMAVCSDLAAS